MLGSVQQITSSGSFIQSFMQFPRQNISRTLLFSIVANVAFYKLASVLTRDVENKYKLVGKEKKIQLRVVVFGGLTSLFNVAQFKLFNYQLSRTASLAIGVAITAVMTVTFLVHKFQQRNYFASGAQSTLSYKQLIDQGYQSGQLNSLFKSLGMDRHVFKVIISYNLNTFFKDVDKRYGSNPALKIDNDEKRESLLNYIINQIEQKKNHPSAGSSLAPISESIITTFSKILSTIRKSEPKFHAAITYKVPA